MQGFCSEASGLGSGPWIVLAHPGVEIEARILAGDHAADLGASAQAADAGLAFAADSDAGPALDEPAKRAYGQRLRDLRGEVEQAEAFHDPGRASRARLEYSAIAEQLAAATGLGGRDRRAGSPAERARLNVTRALKSGIARVAEYDHALGEHLTAHVHTGRLCVFTGRIRSQRSAGVSAPGGGIASSREDFSRPRPSTHAAVRSASPTRCGPIDLIYVPGWLSHLDFQWGGPVFAPFLRSLAEFSRLIMFDKRGVGLSDPVGAAPTLEERMDDVRAVMDAVGSERAALFGTSEGAPIASLSAAAHPERVRALTLYGAFAAGPAVASIPGGAGLRYALARARAAADTAWGEGHALDIFAPSLPGSRTWRRGWGMFERASMSPAMACALLDWEQTLDVRAALPAIGAPTRGRRRARTARGSPLGSVACCVLVVHRVGDLATPIEEGRFVAEQIHGARFVELPGDDHAPITGDMDVIVDALRAFLTDLPDDEPRRVLVTVLSLEATETPIDGDELERIHAVLARAGGKMIGETPTRVTALFDGAARAIRSALTLLVDPHTQATQLRAGAHAASATAEQRHWMESQSKSRTKSPPARRPASYSRLERCATSSSDQASNSPHRARTQCRARQIPCRSSQ